MKVAVIGTSHTGAIHAALPDISASYPQLQLSFFGLPGVEFARAIYQDGVLSPPADNLDLPWMTATSLDLKPFDHILLAGPRVGFARAATLITHHQLLELPEGDGRPFMSTAAMGALIQGLVDVQVQQTFERFGADERFCLLPAPFPLARAKDEGPGQEAMLIDLEAKIHARACFETFEDGVDRACESLGVRALRQPEQTRESFCTTRDKFALAAQVDPETPDHRHMNAAYGRAVFDAYATSILGLDSPDETT